MDWLAEHEQAFLLIKDALTTAPVLANQVQGQPYRLYTDASDDGMGFTQQRIQ